MKGGIKGTGGCGGRKAANQTKEHLARQLGKPPPPPASRPGVVQEATKADEARRSHECQASQKFEVQDLPQGGLMPPRVDKGVDGKSTKECWSKPKLKLKPKPTMRKMFQSPPSLNESSKIPPALNPRKATAKWLLAAGMVVNTFVGGPNALEWFGSGWNWTPRSEYLLVGPAL